MFKLTWLIRDRNYWRSRSESLEAKLESERAANRRFEREMISRMVTLAGQVGIAQEKPPQVRVPVPAIPQPSEQAFNALTAQQQEEWSTYLDDADRMNVPVNQAWNDFYNREIIPHMVFAENETVDVEN